MSYVVYYMFISISKVSGPISSALTYVIFRAIFSAFEVNSNIRRKPQIISRAGGPPSATTGGGRGPRFIGKKIPFSINSSSSNVRFYSTTPNKTTFKDSKDITADLLNKLLKNQRVSITEAELTRLKAIPGVRFDLPLNDQTSSAFEALVGKPNTRGIKAGVYIFTHIASGAKYVGSSNSLSRRLDQYFSFKHFNQRNLGLLIPLINKEGFEAFNLEVFVISNDIGLKFKDSNNLNFNFSRAVGPPPAACGVRGYLFLEQFYLLHEKFNLNTQRIVNFRIDKGKAVYLYSLDWKVLYYCSYSLNEIKSALGIHYATCTNCIKTGNSYLGFFRISTDYLKGAEKTKLSLQELLDLIDMKKKEALKKSSSAKFSKTIIIREEIQEQTLEFSSITMAVKYLKSIGIHVDRNQLAKHLDTNKPYKGYIFSKA